MQCIVDGGCHFGLAVTPSLFLQWLGVAGGVADLHLWSCSRTHLIPIATISLAEKAQLLVTALPHTLIPSRMVVFKCVFIQIYL